MGPLDRLPHWSAWFCCRSSRPSPSCWHSNGPPTSRRSSRRNGRCRRPSSRCGCSTTTSRRCFARKAEVLRHTLTYLRLSLAPTLWLIVPMLGAAAAHGIPLRLHGTDGRGGGAREGPIRRLKPGRLARPRSPPRSRRPMAVGVETPGVLLPSEREIVWRIRPRAAGSYELRLHMGGTVLTKTLLVSDAVARRSPVRPDTGVLNQLIATPRSHHCRAPRDSPRSRLAILSGRSPSQAGTSAGRACTWR